MKNQILSITGPSGGGKSTLARKLAETGRFYPVVSHTTRPMRPGEVSGVDYYFVSPAQFDDLLKENCLIEDIEFHGNRYGAHVGELELAWNSGQIPILILDPNGLQQTHDWCRLNGIELVSVYVDGAVEDLVGRYLARCDKTGPWFQHAPRVVSIIEEASAWPVHFNRIAVYTGSKYLKVLKYDADTEAEIHAAVEFLFSETFRESQPAPAVSPKSPEVYRPRTLEAMQEEVVAWASATFKGRSLESVQRKLIYSELPELTIEIGRGDKAGIAKEVGDVGILLLDLCDQLGIDILYEIALKLEVNRHREWTTDRFGVSQHIRGDEQ